MQLTPFHIAVQVRDLEEAREFYGSRMGLEQGRESSHWIDFNMFGHQFVVHLNPELKRNQISHHKNHVDKHEVPVPHFGVILEFEEWQRFAERARSFVEDFIIEPHIRFEGQTGEQGTMFFMDPSGNCLEFKGFRDIAKDLFAK